MIFSSGYVVPALSYLRQNHRQQESSAVVHLFHRGGSSLSGVTVATGPVTDSLREPGRIASLPALAYVACLQMTRRRRVRGPRAEPLFRMMCSGIEDICLWTLRFSVPKSSLRVDKECLKWKAK